MANGFSAADALASNPYYLGPAGTSRERPGFAQEAAAVTAVQNPRLAAAAEQGQPPAAQKQQYNSIREAAQSPQAQGLPPLAVPGADPGIYVNNNPQPQQNTPPPTTTPAPPAPPQKPYGDAPMDGTHPGNQAYVQMVNQMRNARANGGPWPPPSFQQWWDQNGGQYQQPPQTPPGQQPPVSNPPPPPGPPPGTNPDGTFPTPAPAPGNQPPTDVEDAPPPEYPGTPHVEDGPIDSTSGTPAPTDVEDAPPPEYPGTPPAPAPAPYVPQRTISNNKKKPYQPAGLSLLSGNASAAGPQSGTISTAPRVESGAAYRDAGSRLAARRGVGGQDPFALRRR